MQSPSPHLLMPSALPTKAMAASSSSLPALWASLLLFILLFTTSPETVRASSSIFGLDAALAEIRRSDPHATNDTISSLPSSIKKSLSHSSPPLFNALDRISHITSMELLIPLHIRLVGFNGDDPWQLQHQIANYISTLKSGDPFHIIADTHNHSLALRSKLSLDIASAHSAASLSDRLSTAIRTQMEPSSTVMRSALHSVPYAAVDDIIREDLATVPPGAAYTIYLLNLHPQDRPYAYSYGRSDSAAFTNCLGTLWTGSERYLWIDLGAGPVSYGPALSGDGVLPRGDFHPLATLHGGWKSHKAFLADLASLIWSAAGSLLAPPLRIPVYFETDLLIRFIHIHDDKEIDRRGVDVERVETAFMAEANRGLLLSQQNLRFESYKLRHSECPVCVATVARSMRSYTSRYLFENYTLLVSEYLDSKSLHHGLSLANEELATLARMPDHQGKIIPVYIFDLDYDRPLQLDRFHQAMAFRDMVIAVRSRVSQTVSDYNCNGRHVITQARNLERPIVGALLQSMWGIAPTHLSWSPRHNSTLVDYTWSVGQTPFGPFSESMSLSFVERDAAPRNVLLTTLNNTIWSVVEVLKYVVDHGGERKLLGQKRHVEFTQRWNLFQYKLDKAVSAMSHFDFDAALFYIKSSDHDLFAIHSLIYKAATELKASLVCFTDPPFPWGLAFILMGFFLVPCYAYKRRDRLFSSKRKQF